MRKLYGMDEAIPEPATGELLSRGQFWFTAGCMPVVVVAMVWLALGMTP